jgi:hypothetical protein
MNVKVVVAILLTAVVPVYAQAQSPSAPKVTKADAQKVVKIISGNKAKTQTYCDTMYQQRSFCSFQGFDAEISAAAVSIIERCRALRPSIMLLSSCAKPRSQCDATHAPSSCALRMNAAMAHSLPASRPHAGMG